MNLSTGVFQLTQSFFLCLLTLEASRGVMAILGGVPDNKYFEDKAYSSSSPMPARIILYSKASVLPPGLPSVRRSTGTQCGTWPRSAQVSPMSFGDDRGSDTWDNSRLPYTTPSCFDNELWAAPHINYKDRSITPSTKLPDLNNRLVSPADVNGNVYFDCCPW